jgi:hypothetical protein
MKTYIAGLQSDVLLPATSVAALENLANTWHVITTDGFAFQINEEVVDAIIVDIPLIDMPAPRYFMERRLLVVASAITYAAVRMGTSFIHVGRRTFDTARSLADIVKILENA